MLNRGFNDVYMVVTATNERYVFRLSHHRSRGAADVRTETDFLAHLARSGVPVAAPVQTHEGAFFVHGRSPEGVREGVLFLALGGRAPDAASIGDARANGATLAMVHNAAGFYRAAAPRYKLDLDHLLRRPLGWMRDSGVVEEASATADLETDCHDSRRKDREIRSSDMDALSRRLPWL